MRKSERLPLFDSLRGFAMLIMAVYHFCFDLNTFGLIQQNFNHDLFWLSFRAVIMTLFTGLAGVGFYLGQAKFSSKGYRSRLFKLIACAALISIVTYYMYPQSWVFFGILHLMVIASLIGPYLIQIPRLCLPLGIFFLLIQNYTFVFFNKSFWIVSGLATIKPNTEDFSPIVPWLGTVMIGVFIGYVVKNKKWRILSFSYKPLNFLGHHSLVFYMTHQLLLFPLAWVIAKILN